MSEGLTIARKNNGKKKPGKLANTDVNKENEICPKQNFCGEFEKLSV